jgi:hypothetical protein
MKTKKSFDVMNYIETPRRNDQPVKIDEILKARMQEFIRLRRVTFFR